MIDKIDLQKKIAKKEYEIKLLNIDLQNIENQNKIKKIGFDVK